MKKKKIKFRYRTTKDVWDSEWDTLLKDVDGKRKIPNKIGARWLLQQIEQPKTRNKKPKKKHIKTKDIDVSKSVPFSDLVKKPKKKTRKQKVKWAKECKKDTKKLGLTEQDLNDYESGIGDTTEVDKLAERTELGKADLKDFSSKLPLSKIQWKAIASDKGVMGVYKFAQKKYGNILSWRNRSEGSLQRYLDAMIRHLLKILAGEEMDPESGLHHGAAMAWNALTYLEFVIEDMEAKEKEHDTK